MSTLLLKFGINLESYDLPAIAQHHGPLFHRWLPDGEKDAIVLDPEDSNAKLKVWFERWGFVDSNGWIKFCYNRREIDPNIIPTQAILDAGPLMGLLEIKELLGEELAALYENKVGDARYIALAKRVIKLLYPPVAKFLNVLRINYGQYWIPELRKWDSRRESLGNYCRSLNLKWSLDNGKTWAPFIPDRPEIRITSIVRQSYSEYLTKEDWQELAKAAREKFEPSTAAFLLSRAHQLMDQGDLKYAFIEGVSALEIALREFIRQRLHNANFLLKSVEAFWNLPLRAQVVIVAASLDKVSFQDIEYAIEAIDVRNKIVHNGVNPHEDTRARNTLSGLLNIVSALLSGPTFKFPSANSANAKMPLEEWEKLSQEDHHSA